MQDFVRIHGEIVSNPLNENFRRLINGISRANTNLIFPEQNAVVNTITDMMNINNPVDAQSCYVVSSGEFYRYSGGDRKWHKIMDIGQTFRQGFLNSGAVVLEDEVKLKDGTKNILLMPRMLVYFKNKEGDSRYLKGMYLIEATELNLKDKVSGANAYSILVDHDGNYTISTGMPKQDNPSHVFIGTVLVNGNGEVIEDCIYTLPDIAYTADRGHFILDGGQASGCNLVPSTEHNATVNRREGYYYDEGINYTTGLVNNFPVDTDNGSNYNLKYYSGKDPVEKIIYMIPVDGLNYELTESTGLIYNKYWDGSALADVPAGYFTIQQHLMTPNGQDIILYGNKLYNSMTDAVSNINSTYGINLDFPYVEATRIIVGNPKEERFRSSDELMCRFYTLGRLSQVGTISPQFADNAFRLYSGDANDTMPSSVQFNLKSLQDNKYDNLYTLSVAGNKVSRESFALSQAYITDLITDARTTVQEVERIGNEMSGYVIADDADVETLRQRVHDIEKEIWALEDKEKELYEQGVRFRLFKIEDRLSSHDTVLDNYNTRITSNENNKVNKGTLINGYTLGDNTDKNENKSIVIKTGDISEGKGQGTTTNLWYTEDRVSANTDVAAAKKHVGTVSANNDAAAHTVVNPHNLSTDDIKLLNNTSKVFVSPEEERRIRADRLPENTIQALADLDEKNIDSISISTIDGRSTNTTGTITKFGDIKSLQIYEDGVRLSLVEDGSTAVLECLGQIDNSTFMIRSDYAKESVANPQGLAGFVDKAIVATNAYGINGMATAGANKYYGTDNEGNQGIHDIATYVGTTSVEDYMNIDQVTFVPVDGSVQPKHLESNLLNKINNNYHAIYNTGTLKSAEINTLNFGDNLSVTINGNTATINAASASGANATNFANLSDVDVTYTGNSGKMLVINKDENGIEVADAPAMGQYMLIASYVEPTDITKVKKATLADTATNAASATNALKVNNKSVDDTKNTSAVLWTASQIIKNTSSQIANEGVQTHIGTDEPTNTLGKNGDIYAMIEE